MLKQAAVFILLYFVLKTFISYRDWLNWQTAKVLRVAPGPCKIVIQDGGSEALTHIGGGRIILTSGLNFKYTRGSMKMIDLNNDNQVTTLRIVNEPETRDLLASPHGMSVWRDPQTDQTLVYVLTHTLEEDRIEVYELLPTLDLKYIKTITDPNFEFMNDLQVVGKDQFYITRYYAFRDLLRITIETFLRLHLGKIYYYDGQSAKVVASGFFKPNGLNISPDKKYIYMAECGNNKLVAFRRGTDESLDNVWEQQLGACPDNVEVDPDNGDLWIGIHPLYWRLFDPYNTYNLTAASQVLRVKIRDNNVTTVEQIYADDGEEVAGSTTATYVNGKLVIGTIAAQTAVCDVKYLS